MSSSNYVDLHCHGGGGYYFSDTNIENVIKAVEFHKANGTATLLASLVTAEIHTLKDQIRRLLPLYESGAIAGIHLEGPYLAKARCGAHQPDLLKAPNIDEVASLLEISNGAIKMITFAPELPGALSAISFAAENEVIAAIGHSDGNYQDALDAVSAGATLVTHFSNGMSKLKDGDKTFATALLYQSRIPIEIILDKVHVTESDLHEIFAVANDRMVFVTDAMAAAGMPDGNYQIGKLDVEVTQGVAKLKGRDVLAGSTLTMNEAVANAKSLGLSSAVIENSAIHLPNKLLENL